ncbi:MAG: ChaN family lipoprotein [Chloracidobacterium sp.]|nr:ChaN family lipoprotein [Chloracidobacterium sp.]
MGIDKILASQSLWDATMSNSVARYLKENKRALVVHLVGAFHTESRLGTIEHLLRYRPKTRAIVVTVRYEDDFKTFDKAKHTDIGDYVILTDASNREVSGDLDLPVVIFRKAARSRAAFLRVSSRAGNFRQARQHFEKSRTQTVMIANYHAILRQNAKYIQYVGYGTVIATT